MADTGIVFHLMTSSCERHGKRTLDYVAVNIQSFNDLYFGGIRPYFILIEYQGLNVSVIIIFIHQLIGLIFKSAAIFKLILQINTVGSSHETARRRMPKNAINDGQYWFRCLGPEQQAITWNNLTQIRLSPYGIAGHNGLIRACHNELICACKISSSNWTQFCRSMVILTYVSWTGELWYSDYDFTEVCSLLSAQFTSSQHRFE